MKKTFFKLSFICGHERSTRNEYSQAESRVVTKSSYEEVVTHEG